MLLFPTLYEPESLIVLRGFLFFSLFKIKYEIFLCQDIYLSGQLCDKTCILSKKYLIRFGLWNWMSNQLDTNLQNAHTYV